MTEVKILNMAKTTETRGKNLRLYMDAGTYDTVMSANRRLIILVYCVGR